MSVPSRKGISMQNIIKGIGDENTNLWSSAGRGMNVGSKKVGTPRLIM